jgi:hypothetical protein
MRVAIITWWEVQLPLHANKDLFILQMLDPGGSDLHPWSWLSAFSIFFGSLLRLAALSFNSCFDGLVPNDLPLRYAL